MHLLLIAQRGETKPYSESVISGMIWTMQQQFHFYLLPPVSAVSTVELVTEEEISSAVVTNIAAAPGRVWRYVAGGALLLEIIRP